MISLCIRQVVFQLNGEAVGDEWKNIVVVLNSQNKAAKVALPEGKFYVACADGKCPFGAEKSVQGTATIAPQSAAIYFQK